MKQITQVMKLESRGVEGTVAQAPLLPGVTAEAGVQEH